MGFQKSVESQGIRLLRRLLLQGKRVFNVQDATSTATLENIPHNQLLKILSNLAKQRRLLRLRRGLYVSIGLLPEESNIHPFAVSAT